MAKELLEKHCEKGRMEAEGQRVEKSTPDEELRLKHHFKGLRCPFVCFC